MSTKSHKILTRSIANVNRAKYIYAYSLVEYRLMRVGLLHSVLSQITHKNINWPCFFNEGKSRAAASCRGHLPRQGFRLRMLDWPLGPRWIKSLAYNLSQNCVTRSQNLCVQLHRKRSNIRNTRLKRNVNIYSPTQNGMNWCLCTVIILWRARTLS